MAVGDMSAVGLKEKSGKGRSQTKKCPDCFTHLSLDATVCPYCKKKVGKVDHQGMAKKPVDWKAYLICLLCWAGFGLYMWWAFFRD